MTEITTATTPFVVLCLTKKRKLTTTNHEQNIEHTRRNAKVTRTIICVIAFARKVGFLRLEGQNTAQLILLWQVTLHCTAMYKRSWLSVLFAGWLVVFLLNNTLARASHLSFCCCNNMPLTRVQFSC